MHIATKQNSMRFFLSSSADSKFIRFDVRIRSTIHNSHSRRFQFCVILIEEGFMLSVYFRFAFRFVFFFFLVFPFIRLEFCDASVGRLHGFSRIQTKWSPFERCWRQRQHRHRIFPVSNAWVDGFSSFFVSRRHFNGKFDWPKSMLRKRNSCTEIKCFVGHAVPMQKLPSLLCETIFVNFEFTHKLKLCEITRTHSHTALWCTWTLSIYFHVKFDSDDCCHGRCSI